MAEMPCVYLPKSKLESDGNNQKRLLQQHRAMQDKSLCFSRSSLEAAGKKQKKNEVKEKWLNEGSSVNTEQTGCYAPKPSKTQF